MTSIVSESSRVLSVDSSASPSSSSPSSLSLPSSHSRSYRTLTWIVLFSFFFQTLWPTVAFAARDIPLGTSFEGSLQIGPLEKRYHGLTVSVTQHKSHDTKQKGLHIQAYVEQEDSTLSSWSDAVSDSLSQSGSQSDLDSKSDSSGPDSPRPLSMSSDSEHESSAPPSPKITTRTKRTPLLDRMIDSKTLEDIRTGSSLYKDLVVQENGIEFGFGGLSFLSDWNGQLIIRGVATSPEPIRVESCGPINLVDITASHIMAKGSAITVSGASRITDRLDAWAGSEELPGTMTVNAGSKAFIQNLFIHQGKGHNQGELTIQESLNQRTEFCNHDLLTLEDGAVVKGGTLFINQGDVQGKSYQIDSVQIQNQSTETKTATMTATDNLTVRASIVEQKRGYRINST